MINMARFFVSYSRSVKNEVQKVVDLLRASGHDVWWDGDIPIMADWWATILKNIEWCEVFIFVTSEKSVVSPYCIAELDYANERGRPILPFILDDATTYELPSELPHRSQWLVYDGNPANMLGQINTAYNLIDWNSHNNIPARRPPEPNKGGVSLAKQYQEARQFAIDMEFDKAKQLLRDIKHLDYGEWGSYCDEWLERLNTYEPIMDLVDHDSTKVKARRDWQSYTSTFGKDFDPYDIEQKLQRNTAGFRFSGWGITGFIVVLFVLISAIVYGSGMLSNLERNSMTEEVSELDVVENATASPTDQNIDQDDARETGAAEAYATLTALAPTSTPTITRTPTITPISSSDIQNTARAETFAEATTAAQTETAIAQLTQNSVLTEQFEAGSTATYIANLSLTPPTATLTDTSVPPTLTDTPTDTPSNTPVPATAMRTPTLIPSPLHTVTPIPCYVSTENTSVAIRSGPGTNRAIRGAFPENIAVLVMGQNTQEDDALWWNIQPENYVEAEANRYWVADEDVETEGDCVEIPEVSSSALIPVVDLSSGDDTADDNAPSPGLITWTDQCGARNDYESYWSPDLYIGVTYCGEAEGITPGGIPIELSPGSQIIFTSGSFCASNTSCSGCAKVEAQVVDGVTDEVRTLWIEKLRLGVGCE